MEHHGALWGTIGCYGAHYGGLWSTMGRYGARRHPHRSRRRRRGCGRSCGHCGAATAGCNVSTRMRPHDCAVSHNCCTRTPPRPPPTHPRGPLLLNGTPCTRVCKHSCSRPCTIMVHALVHGGLHHSGARWCLGCSVYMHPLPSALSSMLMCSLLSCTLGCTIAVHTHTLTPHCTHLCSHPLAHSCRVHLPLHTPTHLCLYPCTLPILCTHLLLCSPLHTRMHTPCTLTLAHSHPMDSHCTLTPHTPYTLPSHTHSLCTPTCTLPAHLHLMHSSLHAHCTLTSCAHSPHAPPHIPLHTQHTLPMHTALAHSQLMPPSLCTWPLLVYSCPLLACTLPCTLTLMAPPNKAPSATSGILGSECGILGSGCGIWGLKLRF